MSTMRAVTFDPQQDVVLRSDYPKPSRKKGEALIRVIRVGICNTDIEITKGYANFSGVLGHEFLGVVEEIDDDVTRIQKGQRVVGEINLACGSCQICAAGGIPKRNHCPRRTVLGIVNKDGCFADYITLPVNNLLPVPAGIADERAVFAEPLAAAFRIKEQGIVDETKKVAVLGDGKLGILIAEVIGSQKTRGVTIFGKHANKMDLLPKHIKTVQLQNEKDIPEDEYDVTVEVTGSPEGLKMALSITKPLGVVVLKSTCAIGSDFNSFPIVVKEIQIVGSRCGNFQMALDAMEAGSICPEKMITKVYPIDKALEAIRHAATKGTLKIQLVFQ